MRRLEIRSSTGRDQQYRAFVADSEEVALVAGVSGRHGDEGEPIVGIVEQVRQAAAHMKDLLQQANVKAEPQVVLRVLTSATAEYGNHIDEIGDEIRGAPEGASPTVNVTLTPRLMNDRTLIELDAVLAA